MTEVEARAQLDKFINKFSPNVAGRAREELDRMRALLPCATELVYDNFNALVVGFGPNAHTSDAIFSIAVYPKWVTLFFLHGAALPDPKKLLGGEGNVVRHIRLSEPSTLLSPDVRELMLAAIKQAKVPFSAEDRHHIVIKSISPKQQPRRA
jgi:hypothetical protein